MSVADRWDGLSYLSYRSARIRYTRVRVPTTSSTIPPATEAIPTIGDSGIVFSCSAVAVIGPMSSTFSRFVYVIPPSTSATIPNTISSTPMSFTSSSGAPVVHESRQMRFFIASPRADAAVRLVCFPHAGGTASSYAGWTRALEQAPVEVVAAQLPGRDSRSGETPCTDLDRIVDGFADLIARRDGKPFALFGHSLGALIAFELARRLRERGIAGLTHLFVSGAFAPQLTREETPLRFIEGDAAFLEAVASKYGGVPKIVLEQADLRASIVPALRADITLSDTYEYRVAAPLDCPITAYAGAADPIVSAERLARWREQTIADFSSRLFDGHHFYLNREREALLGDITRRLLR